MLSFLALKLSGYERYSQDDLWAMDRSLGLFAFIEMLIFLAILIFGLVYVWKKGALKWV